jgi:hypothetical protein
VSGRSAVDPWERQSGESPQAFEAFAVYRDLGASRSVAKVARELGKSTTLLFRWSKHYTWVMRATAYDREQDRLFLAEQRQARRDIARRHARVAQAFLGKAVARLQSLDPRELTPGELLRYFQVAAEIERKTVGDERAGASTPDGTQDADAAVLSDEDRRSRMEQLRRELESRLAEGAG